MRTEWILVLSAMVVGLAANPEVHVDKRESYLSRSLRLETVDNTAPVPPVPVIERRGVIQKYPVLSALEHIVSVASWRFSKPFIDAYYVIIKLVDANAPGEPSPWQKIEMQVRAEIKNHLHGYIRKNVENKIRIYSRKRREFKAQYLKLGNGNDGDRKRFIENMARHIDVVHQNFDIFNFNAYKDSLKFDFSLFNMYLFVVTHEQLVYLMLISECRKLKDPGNYPVYDADLWVRKLTQRQERWKRFATDIGPEAGKYLYFSDSTFQCKDGGSSTLNCADFSGTTLPFKYSRDTVNEYEVSMAQRMYQPVAELIRKHFTNEILKLIDEPEVQKLNLDLPKSIFPGNCISPCGLWGWSSKWCATARQSGSKYYRWWHSCP